MGNLIYKGKSLKGVPDTKAPKASDVTYNGTTTGLGANVQTAIDNLYDLAVNSSKVIVKTATIPANGGNVTFTDIPQGDSNTLVLTDFFTEKPIEYSEINTTSPGSIVLTYDENPHGVAVKVHCRIEEVNIV